MVATDSVLAIIKISLWDFLFYRRPLHKYALISTAKPFILYKSYSDALTSDFKGHISHVET